MGPSQPFSWDLLIKQARDLANRSYSAPKPASNAPDTYDASSAMTYGSAATVAGNVRLFPVSKVNAPFPVTIHIVRNGQAREIVDTTGLFVGNADVAASGFRVMEPDGQSDWLAYLGASYFRAVGNRDQYGLSARAIAIDTGSNHGEEFPNFTQFWFEETGPDRVLIHALLDGPSITGAFAFNCRKDADKVTQDIKASLFLRKDVEQFGLAAASSMFWYDQSDQERRPDWRPEIHDSDGLSIQAGNGEQVWRPLQNPKTPKLFFFRADHPKAFGLLQRDQAFDHYEDDGVFYDRRPSLWVEPQGDWGTGTVGLFEMPTTGEVLDNIAMFWKPDAPAKAGQRKDLAYRLTWTSKDPSQGALAICVNNFIGPAGPPGQAGIPGALKYVFDFEGDVFAGLGRDSDISLETSIPSEALISSSTYPVVRSRNVWRAMMDVRISKMPTPEFRLRLKRAGKTISETIIQAIET